MELEIRANAKINLALDVLGERPDGYHEIDTVLQAISLHDTITIESGRGAFCLTCDDPSLELNERNLVTRAWALLKDRVEDPSVVINIEKRIPVAAGLAGGSTDAAATLVGLNRFWELGLSDEELQELGARLGSDVPFFIHGGTQRATGRGEKLTPLKSFRGHPVLLVNCGKPLSSRYVYERVPVGKSMDIDALIDRMAADNPHAFSLMQNRMEVVSFEAVPELPGILKEMEDEGALVARMSGSGPTIFGIFESNEACEKAFRRFEGRYPTVLITQTI